MLRRALLQLRSLVTRRSFEKDLEEEIEHHLELLTEDNIAAGMSPERARRAARRRFGNVTLAREDSRAPWLASRLEELSRDGGYAARWLSRHPLFAGTVILTLALGIGANSAVFSLLDALLLQAPSVSSPEDVYFLGDWHGSGVSIDRTSLHPALLSVPMYEALARRQRDFAGLAAICSYLVPLYVPGDEGPDRVNVALVSGSFFRVLGVGAPLGRVLEPGDDAPEADRVMVLSDRAWRRQFDGDPNVIGRTVTASGVSFVVVGVAPPTFRGIVHGRSTDAWIALAQHTGVEPVESRHQRPEVQWLRVLGRLAPGPSAEAAESNLTTLYRETALEHWGGEAPAGLELEQLSVTLSPLARGPSSLRMNYARPVRLLMTVVGIVLLIACANVANLLLARASSRELELSTRLALGAGRSRLVRQLLTEGALLGLAGGLLGLLFAEAGVRSLVGLLTEGSFTSFLDVGLDGRVVVFTVVVSVVTVLLFATMPALRASKVASRTGGQRAGLRGSRPTLTSLRSWLVVVQVALCLVLLVAAGLFLRTLGNLNSIDSGLVPESVLVATIDPAAVRLQPERVGELYRSVLEGAGGLPGVRAVSLSTYPLYSGMRWRTRVFPDALEQEPESRTVIADMIAGQYFESIGAPLLRGRRFSEDDGEDTPSVAIVNQAFARRFFGGGDPIGRRFGFQSQENSRDVEIVGLVGDFKHHDLRQETPPAIYLSVYQESAMLETLTLRVAGDPKGVGARLRSALASRHPDLPVLDLRSMTAQIDRSLSRERLVGRLSVLFGGLALVLATLGIYAVIAYSVAGRVRELGLRIAVGARRSEVVELVLRDALALVLVGLLLGLPAALGLGQLTSAMLFGLEPSDPLTLAVATAILVAASLLSGYLPARRAARLDPVTALRCD